MKSGAKKSSSTTSASTTHSTTQPFFAKSGGGDFFSPATPSVQTKMTVNKPGDKFEQEADSMADKIMRMENPVPVSSASGIIQRKCAACAAGGPPCQKCREEQKLQRKENNSHTPKISPSVQSKISALRGRGQPLPISARSFFEPRFGRDFSNVRVHNDNAAAESARAIQAKAYTYGSDIVFGAGEYSPDTDEGRKLLAHELTHVVQQGHSAETNHFLPSKVQRYSWGEFVEDAESAGHSAVEGVKEAGRAVGQAASDSLSWIETEAGKLALAGARDLAVLFGGTVRIVGTGIVITIPDMQLCTPRSIPVLTMPMMNRLIPVWGWAGAFGPVGVGAAAGFRFGIQPSLAVSYGPCRLRGMSLLLDPLAGTYAGTAQLYIAGAVAETAVIEAALKAIGVIGLFTPPIALMAGVEGGLRGTFRGIGAGAIQETVRVAYAGGAFSLDLMNTLKLGAALELDLDFFANASLYDFVICEYVLPLASWTLASTAERYNLPVSISGGSVSVGPVTSKPIPFANIDVFINRTRPQTRCLSLSGIKQELCRRGYLPPYLCTTTGPGGATPVSPGIKPPSTGPSSGSPLGPGGTTPVSPGINPPSPGQSSGSPLGSAGSDRDVCSANMRNGRIENVPTAAGGPVDVIFTNNNKHTAMAQKSANEINTLTGICKGYEQPSYQCEKHFCEAVRKRDQTYGSQLGSQQINKNKYVGLIKSAMRNFNVPPGDRGHLRVVNQDASDVGYDISAGQSTNGYEVYIVRVERSNGRTTLSGVHLYPKK